MSSIYTQSKAMEFNVKMVWLVAAILDLWWSWWRTVQTLWILTLYLFKIYCYDFLKVIYYTYIFRLKGVLNYIQFKISHHSNKYITKWFNLTIYNIECYGVLTNVCMDQVSFTGSVEIGREAMKASANSNLKPVSLELGGKSPILIFDDADVDTASELALFGFLCNKVDF